MSGGPTAYRLIGSGVTALCFVIIFWRVFSRNALAVDSSPVPQLANLLRPGSLFVFGGRNFSRSEWLVWTSMNMV